MDFEWDFILDFYISTLYYIFTAAFCIQYLFCHSCVNLSPSYSNALVAHSIYLSQTLNSWSDWKNILQVTWANRALKLEGESISSFCYQLSAFIFSCPKQAYILSQIFSHDNSFFHLFCHFKCCVLNDLMNVLKFKLFAWLRCLLSLWLAGAR